MTTEIQITPELVNELSKEELIDVLFKFKTKSDQTLQNKETTIQGLLLTIKSLQRRIHGASSERYKDEVKPDTLPLFEKKEFQQDQPEDAKKKKQQPKKPKKKSRNLNTSKLKKQVRTLEVPKEDRVCSCCGRDKVKIGELTNQQLHYITEQYINLITSREKLACPRGCAGSISTAPQQEHILPKSNATEEMLAHVVISKLMDRQPTYHLSRKMGYRFNFDLPRHTISNWIIKCAHKCIPLVNCMKEILLEYDVASVDGTRLQVLKEPDRDAQKKSEVFHFLGGPPGKEVVLLEYKPPGEQNFLIDFFEDFSGYVHCDAKSDNKELEKIGISLVLCNYHSRRKYEEITKLVSTEGLAHQAMQFYRELSEIEAEIRDRAMDPDQIRVYRKEHAEPILNKMHQWLTDNVADTAGKLKTAMNYTLKHWDGLKRYLEDGRLSFHNNDTEREIKSLAINRRNFLFCDTVRGAEAVCILMSLLRTAIKHNLDPYRYLVAVFKSVPHCSTFEDWESLLPWNITRLPIWELPNQTDNNHAISAYD